MSTHQLGRVTQEILVTPDQSPTVSWYCDGCSAFGQVQPCWLCGEPGRQRTFAMSNYHRCPPEATVLSHKTDALDLDDRLFYAYARRVEREVANQESGHETPGQTAL